jgi:hypothetical protein
VGPVSGNGITFAAPAPEDLAAAANSYLEVQLTATDVSGASDTVTRDVQPRKVDLTFATAPTGFTVNVNGSAFTGPSTLTSWEGWVLTVEAAMTQLSGSDLWVFSSWADGGANVRQVATPAAPATYTAVYQPSVVSGPHDFFTLAPCRLVDTRNPDGPLGGPGLAARQTREFNAHGACGVPASARAIAVNVAAVSPPATGHLRLHSADEARPATSTLNFAAGRTRANNAILRLGAAGGFEAYCDMPAGSVDLVVDVVGYFE